MKIATGVREEYVAKLFIKEEIGNKRKFGIPVNWRNFYGHLTHHIEHFVQTRNLSPVDILGVEQIVRKILREKNAKAQRRAAQRRRRAKEKARQLSFDFMSDDK